MIKVSMGIPQAFAFPFAARSIYTLTALLFIFLPIASSDAYATATPLAELPIHIIDNRVVVEASIEQYSLQLVLDTGASTTAIFESEKQAFPDLQAYGTAHILFPGLDQTIAGSRLIPVPIRFEGHSYLPEKLVRIERRTPVGNRLNFRFDGVLGQDFFGEYVVEIDPEKLLLRLYSKGTNLSTYFRTKVAMHMKGTAPHIRVNSRMPWEQSKTIVTKTLLLDTGYSGVMVIWSKKHFKWANNQAGQKIAEGKKTGIFTQGPVNFGKVLVLDAPIFLTPNVPKQAVKRDGLFGAMVLVQFHHVIDFSSRLLLLKHKPSTNREIESTFYAPNNEDFIHKNFPRYFSPTQIVIPLS